jgi:hypothetical protein
MVRAVGIEPTLLSERDFESRASTNSTTPARERAIAPPKEHATQNIGIAAYFIACATSNRRILALDAHITKIPDFVTVFKHLFDSALFFGCFEGPETAPAITG